MSQKFTRSVTQTGRKACAEYVINVAHGENIACSKSYAGACEYSNELLGSIKCGEFLD
jgi:hypothetical protein